MTLLILNRGTQPRLTVPKWPFVLNRDSPLAQGLVGWWPMQQPVTQSLVPDISGFGRHGVTTSFPPLQADSIRGEVPLLDGVADYIQTPLPPVFNDIPNNDFSVAFWAKGTIPGQSTFKRLIDIFDDASNYVQFTGAQSVDDMIQFGVTDAGTTVLIAGLMNGASAWTRILGTWKASSNTRTLYIDGIDTSIAPQGSQAAGSIQAITMGRRSNGTAATYWNGRIDDLCTWDRVLPDAEIRMDFDPATRWDRWHEPGRKLYFFPAAAGGVGVGQYPIMVYG